MPLIIETTNWTKLGLPILDDPVSFPYTSTTQDDEFSSFLGCYAEGPECLNKGDIIRLKLSTMTLKVSGSWILAGAKGKEGTYLTLSRKSVEKSKLNYVSTVSSSSIEEVDRLLSKAWEEEGPATDKDVISYYKYILHQVEKSEKRCDTSKNKKKLVS